MNYAEYLQSDVWLWRRHLELERAQSACEFCGAEFETLQVHHLSYKHLGDEHDDELVVLCKSCHADVHEFPKFARQVRELAEKRFAERQQAFLDSLLRDV